MLRTIFPVMIASLVAGCSSSRPLASVRTQTGATNAFIQNGIKIVPPLRYAHLSTAGSDDGGTTSGSLTDAAGMTFRFYVDHRIDTKTPGDIYLNAHPSDPKSVHVLDQQKFREKIGHFESWTNSF